MIDDIIINLLLFLIYRSIKGEREKAERKLKQLLSEGV